MSTTELVNTLPPYPPSSQPTTSVGKLSYPPAPSRNCTNESSGTSTPQLPYLPRKKPSRGNTIETLSSLGDTFKASATRLILPDRYHFADTRPRSPNRAEVHDRSWSIPTSSQSAPRVVTMNDLRSHGPDSAERRWYTGRERSQADMTTHDNPSSASLIQPSRQPSQAPSFPAAASRPFRETKLDSYLWKRREVVPFAQALVVQRAQAPYSAYLRHSWNRIDFIAVVSFWICFFLAITHSEMMPSRHIYIFRSLSVLRCARLLAVTSGTATILSSLKRAMPLLMQVFALTIFFMILFAIIGVQAFKGSYRRQCVWDPSLSNISTPGDSTVKLKSICGGFTHNDSLAGYYRPDGFLTLNAKGFHCPVGQMCVEGDNPNEGVQSFDNIVASLLEIMIIMSANGWSTVMYNMADADYFGWSVLFFVCCLLITNFWMANLIVAVISNTFASITSQTQRSAFAAEAVRPTRSGSTHTASVREETMFRRQRRKAFRIYRWFALTLMPNFSIAVILADVIIQANKSWIELEDITIAFDAHLWFAIYFLVEIAIRISPYALQRDWFGFIRSTRNSVDLCLAIITMIIEVPAIKESAWFPWMTFFSLARFYRFIIMFPFMRNLAGIIFGSTGGLLNMILFLLLMVGLSSLISVQLLRGDVDESSESSSSESSVTFKSIYNSFLGMYQVFTSEDWTDPLWDVLSATVATKQDVLAGIWLCGWFFFANFILLQMFIAVINENFTVAESDRRRHQVEDYLYKRSKGLLDPVFAQNAALAPHPNESFLGRLSPYMYRWREFEHEQHDARLRELGQPVPPRQPTTMTKTLIATTKADLLRVWTHFKGFWYAHQDEEYKLDNLRPHSFTGPSPDDPDRSVESTDDARNAPTTTDGVYNSWPSTVLEFDVDRYENDTGEDGENDPVARGIDRTRTDLGLVVNEPVSQAMIDAEYQERIRNDPKREMILFLNKYPSYDKTLWLFSNRSQIRRVCQSIVSPSYGERIFGRRTNKWAHQAYRIILICSIVASVAIAGFATPTYRKQYMQTHSGTLGKRPWFYFVDTLLTIMFFVEIVVKVIADGLVFSPNAYLMNGWNIMDLFVVATMLVNMLAGENRLARASRAFRPLRFISLSKHIRRTCEHMFGKGVRRMLQASLLAVLYVIPFAVWGQNLFAGQLYSCNDMSSDLTHKSQCKGEYSTSPVGPWTFLAPRVWANPTSGSKYSFDNFHSALLILFEIVSLEGWIDVMLTSMSITGRDRQLVPGSKPVNAMFFVFYNLVGAVIVLTLFVSVIIENFRSMSGTAWLTTAQRQWIDLKRLIARQRPAKRPIRRPSHPFRRWCFDRSVRKDGWSNRIFTLIYAVNAIVLMTDAYGQPVYAQFTRYGFYMVVAFLFLGEALIHLIGLGWRAYALNWWNWFDVAAITGVIVCTSIIFSDVHNYRTKDAAKFFVCAVCFKLIQRVDSLNQLFRTAAVSLPYFISIFALWAVLFLVWGIMTMEIFGLTRWGPNETYRKNFSTLGNAIVFLIMMSTGENWNQYMHDYTMTVPLCLPNDSYLLSDCGSPGWALFLFISWNIISMYIFLNMFTGTVVENFSYVFQLGGKSLLTRKQLRQFKAIWADFDTNRTGLLQREQIVPLLHRLSGALDVKIYGGEMNVPSIMAVCFAAHPDAESLHSSRTGGSRRTARDRAGELFQRMRHHQPQGPQRSKEVNLTALNMCLDQIDVKEVNRRRNRFNRIYQELLLAWEQSSPDEDKRGIPFSQVLLILAGYKLIKEVQALEVADLVERKKQLELIERRISLERVKGILHTSYERKHFLVHQRRMREARLRPSTPDAPLRATTPMQFSSSAIMQPTQLVAVDTSVTYSRVRPDGESLLPSPSQATPTSAWQRPGSLPLTPEAPDAGLVAPEDMIRSESTQTVQTASPEAMVPLDMTSVPPDGTIDADLAPLPSAHRAAPPAPRVARRQDTLDRFEDSQWSNVLSRINVAVPPTIRRTTEEFAPHDAAPPGSGSPDEAEEIESPISTIEPVYPSHSHLGPSVRRRPNTYRRETPSVNLTSRPDYTLPDHSNTPSHHDRDQR